MKHLILCALILITVDSAVAGNRQPGGGSSLVPVLTVQPDSIALTLTVGDSAMRTLTIGNSGSDSLQWSIPRLGGTSTANRSSSIVETAVAGMRSLIKEPAASVRCPDGIRNVFNRTSGWIPEQAVTTIYADNPPNSNVNIALVHGESNNADPYVLDVQTKLMATGSFASITLIAARSVTPTLDQLLAFDAVLVWSSYPFADGTTLGNNLANYVDGGGGVVVAQFAMDRYLSDSTYILGGRFASGGYYAILPGSDIRNTQLTMGTVQQPSHTVMAGVTSFSGGSSSFHSNSALATGAIRIADWSDGQPLIAEKNLGGQRRIDLNFWPVSSDVFPGGWLTTTQGARIMAQALMYVREPSFVTVAPDAGILAPSSSIPVQVKVNARYLSVGNYRQTIPVTANDPLHPLKSIPVKLNVIPPVMGVVEFEVPMIVTDGVAAETLYFGVLPNANICIVGDSYNGHTEVALPPPPPSGLFESRFISPRTAQAATCYDQGSAVDFRPFSSGSQLDTFRVRTQMGEGSVLSASWPSGLSAFFTSLKFRYFDGDVNVNVDMLSATSVDFTLAGDPAVINIFSGGLTLPVPGFSVSPKTLAFGNVHLLLAKQDSVTVTNQGSSPFDISSVVSNDPHFTITPLSGTVPPQGIKKFYITFTPTQLGAVNSKVIFLTNALFGQDTVVVSGTGVQGQFVANRTSILFDSVFVTQSKQDSVLIRNTGTGLLTISDMGVTNPGEFSVAEAAPLLMQPGDSARIHVSFHPTSEGLKTGYLKFDHDGNTVHDSIPLSGTGYLAVHVTVPLAAEWNLISNPVTNPIPGDSVRQLFPSSTFPHVYEFNGAYIQRFRVVNGKGYWGRFPAAVMNTITGAPRTRDTIGVVGGWNIVGSISNPVDTGTITSVPPGLRGSNWYGYSATGYAPAAQIVPGKGYWVKANGTGVFIVANPLVRPSMSTPAAPSIVDILHSLTITDSKGSAQTLYFGTDEHQSIPVAMYDLPPLPPSGAFDARIVTASGGSMVLVHPKHSAEFDVSIQADAYPITVSWNMHDASYELAAGGATRKAMTGEGILKIDGSEVHRLHIKLANSIKLPTEYALGQNYPNPFNPVTIINYDLPADSRVSLKVFNLVGQQVATLVDENQQAGYKSVEWNAGKAPSGVYFYRLQAGNFTSVRKLMILK